MSYDKQKKAEAKEEFCLSLQNSLSSWVLFAFFIFNI